MWWFILLVVLHYIADFRLQTDWQAQNKWCNTDALLHHTITYTLFMGLALWPFLGWAPTLLFAFWTWVLHTWTDANTAPRSHRWAEVKDWYRFFGVVGFDQVLHYIQLVVTLHLVAGKI